MDGTILSQGSFLANYAGLSNPNPGVASVSQANGFLLNIPSGVDWLMVRNYTQFGTDGVNDAYFNGTANAFVGYEFYWQRGFGAGLGIVQYKSDGDSAKNGDTFVSGGFTLYDASGQSIGSLPLVGNPVATTASTNATRPVVTTASTAGLYVGSVVRMSNTAQTDVNGIDMVVGAVSVGANFTLLTASNPLANVPGAIGGAGFYRIINVDSLFYPRHRYVVKITQAVNAQVSTSVAHGLTAGQAIRFSIPDVSGMIQLNPLPGNNYLLANIVSVVDDYNFLIDVDTSAFTPFTWPTIAQQPSSFPQMIPVGEDTGLSLVTPQSQVPEVNGLQIFGTQSGLLADATTNTGFLGMLLGAGGNGNALGTPILGPAGSISWSSADVGTPDLLYWVAGKASFGGL